MHNQILILAMVLSVTSTLAQTSGLTGQPLHRTGIVITSLSTDDDEANAMAIQNDGKIIVAGYSKTDFAMVRFQADGALDSGFGKDGLVITSIRCGDDHNSSLTIQSDGKIVVAGSTNIGTGNDFAVIRYNTDGTQDPSFGKRGVVITSISSGDDNATGIAIQTDGKIVVAGSSNNGSNNDFAILRYNTDGTLDPAFGKGGMVITSLSTGDDQVSAVAIQPDRKIIVVGYSNTHFAVARYNANGTLDPSFGKGGKAITSLRSGEDEATAICIQQDGKIVVAGSSSNGLSFDFAIVRYNMNGTLDPTFGQGGSVTTAIRDGDDNASSVTIQPDGKIIAAGSSNNGTSNDFATIRYNSNGTLDPVFGEGGIVITSIRTGDDQASALVLQPDGKIVTAGNSNNGSSNDFAVIRYNSNGTFDSDFGKGTKQ